MTIQEAIAIMGPFAAEDRARLKSRYRRLAFLHHPDRNGSSHASYAHFTRINQAYHLLDRLLESEGSWNSALCAGCGVRPARLRGLDRNPYCRDCLMFAGGRRLLPAPPTVIASCAFAAVAQAVALIELFVFLATNNPLHGIVTLTSAGAGIIFLAVTAILIGRTAPATPRGRKGRRLRLLPRRRRMA